MTRTGTTIAALTIFAAAGLAAPQTTADDGEATVGAAVADFALKDEQGVEHKLSGYQGKAVVLEWTNPSCPYVKRHYDADTMEKLATALGADGVVWFAVNSTKNNTPADTVAWRESQGFEYATLQDPSGDVGRALGARTTPHMFVVDGKGVLRYSGAIDDDPHGRVEEPTNYVDGAVRALLAGTDPNPSETQPYGCSVKYSRN